MIFTLKIVHYLV